MRYVQVTVTFPPSVRHPMHAFLDDGDGWRTEMVTWRRLPDETLATLFRVAAPREPYLERLRAVDTIERFETAPGDPPFYLKAYERLGGPLEAFLGAFADTELISVPPLVYRSGGRLSFGLIGPPDQLRDALASMPDRIEVEIGRIGSYAGGRRLAGVEVTERQREVVRAARRVGYYEVPRTGSVGDVADAVGCSSSTAGTHLRKAESALVDAFLSA
ncbi:helix-turn-helix domain-containing protein [Halorubrum tebenquichense]|uniref:Bacterio-opsin activator HTH domain protein n=1 Tax=Halorubrum tebenquichense DSM 14210 TaxID=1227485 RepID=M0D9D1_9EURY|nr:helix-turn-helix domain-containing protein [Halorubrum tebenquichense]ELZ32066.1 Bacterio-opsin activator HTH domain protein [Halorubrum tebenquichense DSM 14210]